MFAALMLTLGAVAQQPVESRPLFFEGVQSSPQATVAAPQERQMATPADSVELRSNVLDQGKQVVVVFNQPAFFRYPPDSGCDASRGGLLIYEGMSLTIEPNGEYSLSMVVESPPLETTLYFQLQGVVDDELVTVTLPPVRIKPTVDESTSRSRTYHFPRAKSLMLAKMLQKKQGETVVKFDRWLRNAAGRIVSSVTGIDQPTTILTAKEFGLNRDGVAEFGSIRYEHARVMFP